MQTITHVTSHTLLRQAVANHEPWIRSRLSCALADTVILRTDFLFSQLGLSLLADCELAEPRSRTMRAVRRELELVTLPPGAQPIVDLVEREGSNRSGHAAGEGRCHPYALTWAGSPVAFKLRSLPCELIALRVIRFGQVHETGESIDDILVAPRKYAEEVAAFLAQLTAREDRPMVRTWGEAERPVEPLGWDRLTLAPEIRQLLQDDFESFFTDQAWYKRMHLPHRRGYLLHGPPGNGKTSAVRAMLTSRKLTAYQLRLFGKHTDDGDLERLFQHAAANSPAMVLLEDLDRAFPRSGNRESKVHLQTLLNCLDGVGTEPGVITVATANDPSLLDPAVLRRPGRFDRVVLFANPNSALRREYLLRMHPPLGGAELAPAIAASDGFSYALLREAYIMAAQTARFAERELAAEDLTASAETLRRNFLLATRKDATAGFIKAG